METRVLESDSFIAQAKILRVMTLMRLLHSERATIKDIQKSLDVPERTAYRYLILLGGVGIKVEYEKCPQSRGKRYFISKDNCPLCGNTTNNHYETKNEGSSVQID